MDGRLFYSVGSGSSGTTQLKLMAQLIFLNELSSVSRPLPLEVAQESLTTFVDVLIEIVKLLPMSALISPQPLPSLEVCHGYSMSNWFNSSGIHRDKIRFVLGLANRAPFSAVIDHYGDPDPGVSVHRHAGEIVIGIGLADLYGGIPISFSTDASWQVDSLHIDVELLLDDEERAWSIDIPHMSMLKHVEHHKQWLLERKERNVANAADLLKRCTTLYPFLIFGPGIEDNLLALEIPAFKQVVYYLEQLDDAVALWTPTTEVAPNYPPHTTDESATRKPLCFFPDPKGGRDYFTWHGRYTPGAGRIHFRIQHEPRKAILGYIGKKVE